MAHIVREFLKENGSLSCASLVGYDFKDPGGYQEFLESGIWREKCLVFVQFVIEKFYEMTAKGVNAMKGEKVTVYTKTGCPYCARAMADMNKNGVVFEEINVDTRPGAKETLMKLTEGKGIVPVTVTESGKITVGYNGGG